MHSPESKRHHELKGAFELHNRACVGKSTRSFTALMVLLGLISSQLIFFVASPAALAQSQPATPRVTDVVVRKIEAKNEAGLVPIVVSIVGEKFGTVANGVSVDLLDKDSGMAIKATVYSIYDNEIIARAIAPVGEYKIKLVINGLDIESSTGFAIVMEEEKKADPPKAPTAFEISFETFKSEQYPQLYSLVISNKSEGEGFAADPNFMKVDIVPAGATNVTVQPGSSPRQMMVTFIAPDKFVVKNVLVTVYNPDAKLRDQTVARYATPFKEKSAKTDPNQPKIDDIDVLALNRRTGFGRLKIQGSGFGDYEKPPFQNVAVLRCGLRPGTDYVLNGNSAEQAALNQDIGTRCPPILDWRSRLAKRINILLTPRNADYAITHTGLLYADDNVIEVEFKFANDPKLSVPFRLESATVTVNKTAVKSGESVKSPANDVAVAMIKATVKSPQTFVASHEVGAKVDKNLEYRFTVLRGRDARRLFGAGVGKYFYVIQLSVVNNGTKKVAIPLSSIQAEIEWAYGPTDDSNLRFEEGPATIGPMPLPAISGYFDAFQKSTGTKAKIFNILQGVVTLGGSLIPVFGKNIERPTSILAAGLIPGLRTALGDLSSQQLQNLTALSWEGIEEVPVGGGLTKYIYIQRGDQRYGEDGAPGYPKVKKRVMNIRGLEVAGFEIVESEKKLAAPTP